MYEKYKFENRLEISMQFLEFFFFKYFGYKSTQCLRSYRQIIFSLI